MNLLYLLMFQLFILLINNLNQIDNLINLKLMFILGHQVYHNYQMIFCLILFKNLFNHLIIHFKEPMDD